MILLQRRRNDNSRTQLDKVDELFVLSVVQFCWIETFAYKSQFDLILTTMSQTHKNWSLGRFISDIRHNSANCEFAREGLLEWMLVWNKKEGEIKGDLM